MFSQASPFSNVRKTCMLFTIGIYHSERYEVNPEWFLHRSWEFAWLSSWQIMAWVPFKVYETDPRSACFHAIYFLRYLFFLTTYLWSRWCRSALYLFCHLLEPATCLLLTCTQLIKTKPWTFTVWTPGSSKFCILATSAISRYHCLHGARHS